jgi:predicted AAA+ superfamily ATPase
MHGMGTIRNRWLTRQLQAALKALPVVVLTGARQTGKTTLAQSLPQKRIFVSLDDLGVLGQAHSDPDSLLASRPVTLDDVQRAPELLLPVKRQVDRQRKAGDFLLTGSANLLLMGKASESLAGRAVYLDLPPFCPTEWQERPDGLEPLDRLFERDFALGDWPEEAGDWQGWLLRGGFPSALSAPSDEARKLWFAGYVQTYLEEDGVLVALEIKASQQVSPSDADGIVAFRQGLGQSRRFQCGAVLHAGAARPLGQGLWALPWNWLVPELARAKARA